METHTSNTSVGHGQKTLFVVLDFEVLILKLGSIDALSTSAIATGEVTTLDHETGDDAVELAALVVEGFASLASTLLTGGEGTEVLGGLGDGLAIETHHDATSGFSSDCDVEEDFVGDLGALLKRVSCGTV